MGGSRHEPEVPEKATMVPEARRDAANDTPGVRRFRWGLVTFGTVEAAAPARLLDTPEMLRLKMETGYRVTRAR
jgi:hypothetical protein